MTVALLVAACLLAPLAREVGRQHRAATVRSHSDARGAPDPAFAAHTPGTDARLAGAAGATASQPRAAGTGG